jgi:hypothetical protein
VTLPEGQVTDMTENRMPDNDVATLMLFRPEITHFDDEWGPARREATLTGILAPSSPSRSKRTRPTGQRWKNFSALAAGAAAAAVAVGLLLPAGGPGGPDAAAAATLNELSAIAGSAGGSVGTHQFAYVLEDSEQTMSAGEAQTPVLPGETRVGDLVRDRGEQWTSPNGTVWRTVALEGNQSCLAKHLHDGNAGRVADYENLSTPELAQLPTDPDQLANYIDTHPSGDNRGDSNRFVVVGDVLRSGLAAPALRAAALRVLAQTTDLTVATDSHDAAGRRAIRVDHSFGYGVESLFFDASTSRVLEEQTTQDQYLFRALVRESKVVNSLPTGVPLCPKPTTKPG